MIRETCFRSFALAACTPAVIVTACGDDSAQDPQTSPSVATIDANSGAASSNAPEPTEKIDTERTFGSASFRADVWADNWFALYVNCELVGEDSVTITTERSFNAETITFDATYPLTIAIEAKDFKETDSGLEYIGERNQQMGDGGIIAQITDTSSGDIAAAANAAWFSIVVHRAPLIKDCEKDSNPYDNCQFEITDIPTNWASAEFNDNAWTEATKWTENDVGPKDGYNQIPWGTSARLIWGSDLEVDNTVLLRMVVEG